MKSLSKALQNIFFSKNPFFLVFFVTSRCNASCKMCFNWENIANSKNRKELSLIEIEKITRHIENLQQLTISGGEPFLREDLAEICYLFNKNCNVQFITIPTNALLTTRIEKILTRIVTMNPKVHIRIGLSMPQIGPYLDDIYQVKNSFEKLVSTSKLLQKMDKQYKNLNVDIGIVCNKYNLDNIKNIIDYTTQKMSNSNPIVSMVRGRPRFKDAKDIPVAELETIYKYCKEKVIKISNRPLADLMNLMRDMVHQITIKTINEKRMQIPCYCGKRLLVIYDEGSVYPCELLNIKLGNLREHQYNLSNILKLKKNRPIINNIVRKKCYCTWECAINNNIIFSNKKRLELLFRYVTKCFTNSKI